MLINTVYKKGEKENSFKRIGKNKYCIRRRSLRPATTNCHSIIRTHFIFYRIFAV